MNAHLGMPEDADDDWRARWTDRLREIGGEPGDAEEEPAPDEADHGSSLKPPTQQPSAPAEMPGFDIATPEASEARRRVQSEVDRARAEMEELVRQAAAIEAGAAESATIEHASEMPGPSPQPDQLRSVPAAEPFRPAEAVTPSGETETAEKAADRLDQAIRAAEQIAARVDAATERARKAATEADVATRQAESVVEKADAATQRAELAAERAEQMISSSQAAIERADQAASRIEAAAARAAAVQAEAERAVTQAEAKLGEMLDALLHDLRQIGDPL